MNTHNQLRKPLRTCVVCGEKSEKRTLTRLVSSSSGGVKIDPTGRMAGRGAYFCSDGKCIHGNIKKGRLEQALRIGLSDNEWVNFVSEIDRQFAKGTAR